jgi:hypothetical protein
MPANRRKVGATAPHDRWVLLGKLLAARRRELGYTWRAPLFERDRDVNRRMAADFETAAPKRVNHFTDETLRHVARGYKVTYRSVLAVLHGERDDLAPAPDALPGEDAPPMSAERAAADRPWYDPINERRFALAAEGILDPSGGQMFPGDPESARAWDSIAPFRMSVGDKVWALADLHRWAAGRKGNSGEGTASA